MPGKPLLGGYDWPRAGCCVGVICWGKPQKFKGGKIFINFFKKLIFPGIIFFRILLIHIFFTAGSNQYEKKVHGLKSLSFLGEGGRSKHFPALPSAAPGVFPPRWPLIPPFWASSSPPGSPARGQVFPRWPFFCRFGGVSFSKNRFPRPRWVFRCLTVFPGVLASFPRPAPRPPGPGSSAPAGPLIPRCWRLFFRACPRPGPRCFRPAGFYPAVLGASRLQAASRGSGVFFWAAFIPPLGVSFPQPKSPFPFVPGHCFRRGGLFCPLLASFPQPPGAAESPGIPPAVGLYTPVVRRLRQTGAPPPPPGFFAPGPPFIPRFGGARLHPPARSPRPPVPFFPGGPCFPGCYLLHGGYPLCH